MAKESVVFRLADGVLGHDRASQAVSSMIIPPALLGEGEVASRAQVAMALNMALFIDLLERVPTARAHVDETVAQGAKICFDHGALRSIDGPSGALPRGHKAFARLLEPMGYAVNGLYPLPRLCMTGRAYAHQDMPEDIPQFFVSELHVDQLPDAAQAAAVRVFGTSIDPLGDAGQALLDQLAREGACDVSLAEVGLPELICAFGRFHDDPALEDYETMLAHTAEGAWIATEGNAFNHVTERVPDVIALAEALKARGLPLKDRVEISTNGRVRQTAIIADKVMRRFRQPDGTSIERAVPGSFYEFISRDPDPETGGPDLSFDSGNATAIFAVTR